MLALASMSLYALTGCTSSVPVNDEMMSIVDATQESARHELDKNAIIAQAAQETGLSVDEVRRKIDMADKYNATQPTTAERYKNEDTGIYTAERSALHGKILADVFRGKQAQLAAAGTQPRAIMLGGRGGAGKSQFEGMVYTQDKYILLNSDEFKKVLPEYRGFNANEVHEESGDLLDLAIAYAVKHRYNIVIDATMSGKDSTEALMKEFKKNGYQIDMYFMHLPREISTMRGIKRYVSKPNGRYVPYDVLISMTDCEKNFYELLPYATNWAFYTNLEGYKSKPKYIDGSQKKAEAYPAKKAAALPAAA